MKSWTNSFGLLHYLRFLPLTERNTCSRIVILSLFLIWIFVWLPNSWDSIKTIGVTKETMKLVISQITCAQYTDEVHGFIDMTCLNFNLKTKFTSTRFMIITSFDHYITHSDDFLPWPVHLFICSSTSNNSFSCHTSRVLTMKSSDFLHIPWREVYTNPIDFFFKAPP